MFSFKDGKAFLNIEFGFFSVFVISISKLERSSGSLLRWSKGREFRMGRLEPVTGGVDSKVCGVI